MQNNGKQVTASIHYNLEIVQGPARIETRYADIDVPSGGDISCIIREIIHNNLIIDRQYVAVLTSSDELLNFKEFLVDGGTVGLGESAR